MGTDPECFQIFKDTVSAPTNKIFSQNRGRERRRSRELWRGWWWCSNNSTSILLSLFSHLLSLTSMALDSTLNSRSSLSPSIFLCFPCQCLQDDYSIKLNPVYLTIRFSIPVSGRLMVLFWWVLCKFTAFSPIFMCTGLFLYLFLALGVRRLSFFTKQKLVLDCFVSLTNCLFQLLILRCS